MENEKNIPVRFIWAAPKSSTSTIASQLRSNGADIETENGVFDPPLEEKRDYVEAAFEPFTCIVGTVLLFNLGLQIYKNIVNNRRGGIVVDARGEKLEVRNNPNVPAGVMLTVSNSGVEAVEITNQQQVNSILELLLSLGGAG